MTGSPSGSWVVTVTVQVLPVPGDDTTESMTGASLVSAMVRVKVVAAVAPAVSVAVTVMVRVPTSVSAGVPVKTRVSVLKLSQAGRGLVE